MCDKVGAICHETWLETEKLSGPWKQPYTSQVQPKGSSPRLFSGYYAIKLVQYAMKHGTQLVMALNGIQPPPDWPLPLKSLDLSGNEFVNTETGEKILLYSLYRWHGTASQLETKNHRGHYTIEFVSAGGERGTLTPQSLGLEADVIYFGRGYGTTKNRWPNAGEAQLKIEAAIRGIYGIIAGDKDHYGLKINID